MLWWAYRPWELVCIYSVAVTPHDILYVGFLYFLVNWLHLKGQWKLYGFQGSINSVHKNQSDQSENMDHTNLSDGGEEVLSGRWRIISSTLEKDEVQIAVSLSLSKMLMEKKTKWYQQRRVLPWCAAWIMTPQLSFCFLSSRPTC